MTACPPPSPLALAIAQEIERHLARGETRFLLVATGGKVLIHRIPKPDVVDLRPVSNVQSKTTE